MESYTVIIQPEAEQDMDDAFEFYEKQQPGLGFQLLEGIAEVAMIIEVNPFLFPKIHAELRRAVVQKFRYNLIYKVVDSEVYILAIMHGNRNPGTWKNRK